MKYAIIGFLTIAVLVACFIALIKHAVDTFAPEFHGAIQNTYAVDTLCIHGVPHEFVEYGGGYGSLCHSPECWCFDENCPD
jgi:hypothetical protein